MKNLIIIVVIAFMATSCAFHSGMMTSNASLSGNNFELIDIALGTSYTTKYFGIGGLDRTALVFDAKKDLYKKYPLKKGQAYANLSVDFQNKFILFVAKTVVTISADIVQYSDGDDMLQSLFDNRSRPLKSLSSPADFNPRRHPYNLADTVYQFSNRRVNKFIVKGILIGNRELVLERLSKSSDEMIRVSFSSCYNKTPDESLRRDYPFFVGDSVEYVDFEMKGKTIKGKVIAISLKRCLIETDDKSIVAKNYNSL